MNKGLLVLLIIGSLAVIVAVAMNFKEEDDSIAINMQVASRGEIVEKVNGVGKIEPDLQVQISAKVAGEIVRMPVEEGDSVRAGQFLLQLEREQYEAALEQSRSTLKGARATLKKTEMTWERVQQLAGENLASDAEVENARADYDFQVSQVEKAEAAVEDAQTSLSKTTVRSPINGIITSLDKKVGEIALGSTFQKDVIMTIADLQTMQARIEVDENDVVKVTLGDSAEVEIDAFPERSFPGVVSEIANSAIVTGLGTQEEVTEFEVRIDLLEILPRFRPGMSCNADIITMTKEDVLRIPIESVAVRTLDEVSEVPGVDSAEVAKSSGDLVEIVFVVEQDTARLRPIKRGISDDSYYEAISGVADSAMIVTGPYRVLTRELSDGQAVREERRKQEQGEN
jgi:HlyD family secretion protein